MKVEISIGATSSDSAARYHGLTVDSELSEDFWATQPSAIIDVTEKEPFSYSTTVDLLPGTHYVVYGNSADAGYMWDTVITVNGKEVARGQVDRRHYLKADLFPCLGELWGSVREKFGDLLPEVKVTLGERSIVTDSEGKFSLTDIPCGLYSLKLSKRFFKPLELNVNIVNGMQTLDLSVERILVAVRAKIRDLVYGEPFEGIDVRIGELVGKTDSAGDVNFTLGQGLIYELEANHPEFNSATFPIDLQIDETSAYFDLSLNPIIKKVSIKGNVVNIRRHSLPLVDINVLHAGELVTSERSLTGLFDFGVDNWSTYDLTFKRVGYADANETFKLKDKSIDYTMTMTRSIGVFPNLATRINRIARRLFIRRGMMHHGFPR